MTCPTQEKDWKSIGIGPQIRLHACNCPWLTRSPNTHLLPMTPWKGLLGSPLVPTTNLLRESISQTPWESLLGTLSLPWESLGVGAPKESLGVLPCWDLALLSRWWLLRLFILVRWWVGLFLRSLSLSLVTHFAFVMAMPVVASPSFFFFFFLSTLLVLLHVSPIVAETEDRDPHLGTIRVVFQVLTLFVCLSVCLFSTLKCMQARCVHVICLFVCLFSTLKCMLAFCVYVIAGKNSSRDDCVCSMRKK